MEATREYENGERVVTLLWLSPVDGSTGVNCELEAGSVGTVLCHVTAGLVSVQMDSGECVYVGTDRLERVSEGVERKARLERA